MRASAHLRDLGGLHRAPAGRTPRGTPRATAATAPSTTSRRCARTAAPTPSTCLAALHAARHVGLDIGTDALPATARPRQGEPWYDAAAAVFGSEGAWEPESTLTALARFAGPVLVLAGEYDVRAPPPAMPEVAELFPDAAPGVQAGDGHFPWRDGRERSVPGRRGQPGAEGEFTGRGPSSPAPARPAHARAAAGSVTSQVSTAKCRPMPCAVYRRRAPVVLSVSTPRPRVSRPRAA